MEGSDWSFPEELRMSLLEVARERWGEPGFSARFMSMSSTLTETFRFSVSTRVSPVVPDDLLLGEGESSPESMPELASGALVRMDKRVISTQSASVPCLIKLGSGSEDGASRGTEDRLASLW